MFLKFHLPLSVITRRRRSIWGAPDTPTGEDSQVKHALHAAARRPSARSGIRYKELVSSWPF
jgi:hypothetical protein